MTQMKLNINEQSEQKIENEPFNYNDICPSNLNYEDKSDFQESLENFISKTPNRIEHNIQESQNPKGISTEIINILLTNSKKDELLSIKKINGEKKKHLSKSNSNLESYNNKIESLKKSIKMEPLNEKYKYSKELFDYKLTVENSKNTDEKLYLSELNCMSNKDKKRPTKILHSFYSLQEEKKEKSTTVNTKSKFNNVKNTEGYLENINSNFEFNVDELKRKVLFCSIVNFILYMYNIIQVIYNVELSYNFIDIIFNVKIDDYKKNLDITIKDFLFEKFIKINNEENIKTKIQIEYLLKNEKENGNDDKYLNICFSLTISEIIKIYINDEPEIQNLNKYNCLIGYITFENDLSEYSKEEKNKTKENILSSLFCNAINKPQLNNNVITAFNKENNELFCDSKESSKESTKVKCNKKCKSKIFIIKKKKKCLNRYGIRRKIITTCLNNIVDIIKELYTNNNKNKLYEKLHKPYSKPQIKHSFEDYRVFFKKNLKQIFCDSLPKYIKKNQKIKHKENIKDNYNCEATNNIIEAEQKFPDNNIKIFSILFEEIKFGSFLYFFLNDIKEMKIEDKNQNITISLNGFKTLADCFNDEYSEEEKQLLKKDMENIILGDGKYKGRKKKIITNKIEKK